MCKGDIGRLSFGGPGGAPSAAVGAQVPQEPAVPVRARLVLGGSRSWRSCCAVRPVHGGPAQRPVPADPLLAERLVLAPGPAARSSPCSAASRSQPQWQGVHLKPRATYEPVPRSR